MRKDKEESLETGRAPKYVYTLFLMWVGHFFTDIMIGIWPVYKTIANLDIAICGLITGICAFSGEFTQMFFGPMSDKGYRRMCLVIGVLATTSSAFFSYTENYMALFFLFLCTYVGSGAFHPAAASIVSSLSENRKAFYITIFVSGGALGMGFSQLVFWHAYDYLHGHTALLVFPSLFLALYFFCFAFPVPKQKTTRRRINLDVIKLFFQNRELRLLYWISLCNQAVYWAAIFLLPDILEGRGYAPWISYGGGHLVFIFGGALMMIPGGLIADRYSPKVVLGVGTGIGCLGLYTFALFPFLSVPILLTLLLVTGATLGVLSPVAIAFGNRLLPSYPGMVSAFLMGCVWCFSESLGPGIGGMLTYFFADEGPAKALAVISSSMVLSFYFILRLPYLVQANEELEYTFENN